MLQNLFGNSLHIFISGITLILGIVMLRLYHFLKTRAPKQNAYDRFREQIKQTTPTGGESDRDGRTSAQLLKEQKANSGTAYFSGKIQDAESLADRHREADRFDVELLTLSRQIKAEIDTKIVALQLMIADADRVLQALNGHVSQAGKTSSAAKYHEPDRMRIIKQEETEINASGGSAFISKSGLKGNAVDELAHLNEIVIEDPFVESDFGFNRAMRELDELSSKIPAFVPPCDISQTTGKPALEQPAPHESAMPPLPDWDSPVSYPISSYAKSTKGNANINTDLTDRPESRTNPTSSMAADDANGNPSEKNKTVARPAARKRSYTNKILSQSPPQIDSLMTNDIVRKMGSKPLRATRDENTAQGLAEDEALAAPVIPKITPPSAKTILVEGAPYSPPETELDKIAVRKAKRHQLHYLISKGMSPKDIAAHLEMPVGEVELILSLHKRLSGETAQNIRRPLTDGSPDRPVSLPEESVKATVPKGIIPAEHVAIQTAANNDVASNPRPFHVVSAESNDEINDETDEEQVA